MLAATRLTYILKIHLQILWQALMIQVKTPTLNKSMLNEFGMESCIQVFNFMMVRCGVRLPLPTFRRCVRLPRPALAKNIMLRFRSIWDHQLSKCHRLRLEPQTNPNHRGRLSFYRLQPNPNRRGRPKPASAATAQRPVLRHVICVCGAPSSPRTLATRLAGQSSWSQALGINGGGALPST